MLDVATSDDANDWPWGNDLLRQGERKKGARRETASYVSTKQWQLKKKKKTQIMLCKYHITHMYHQSQTAVTPTINYLLWSHAGCL